MGCRQKFRVTRSWHTHRFRRGLRRALVILTVIDLTRFIVIFSLLHAAGRSDRAGFPTPRSRGENITGMADRSNDVELAEVQWCMTVPP
ncbi:hypothetical protein CGCSCA4_v010705 [Colletotrichum siamense]|uniref:Uncharacterized protein n=1 Tax=Colletotrichum siamense TaxID=690259 RepID=A0A9P5BPG2_COLSI|nr:hypothetical protein CGCSCA4_v010705 [Colletotrichum siamense]KAF4846765.1 hypothetical protein CGCSCA2_v012953 [Colletotrichum siamense]